MARKWWTLATVSVATFMLLLDITVVNTALPSIEADLGASFSELQWVIDAYALSIAALVLTAGSLADRLGRRRVFAAGLVIFSLASGLAALAPDPTFLNVARAVQGVGGAIMFAVSLALIAQEFPAGRARGTAMGVYGATIGVAVAIGPLVGGALTDSLGWQSIFYVNVPIALAALAATYLKLRESRDPNATQIDWPGVATFSGALFALVLALIRGNAEGWGSTLIVSLLALAAVLLVAFVAIERRVAEPMLPLGLFKRPAFTGVQLAAFAVSGSLFALILYLTLYLQNYLGLSPLEAGLRYLPITLASFLVAPIAGALLSRVKTRALMATGLAGAGVGLVLMSGIGAGDEWTTLLGGFLVAGVGVGLLNPVIADVALSVAPKEQSGMASGINDTFRQIGVAVGIAAWGAVFLSSGADQVRELLAGTPAASGERPRQLVEAASSGNLDQAIGGLPAAAHDNVVDAAREGFLAGLNQILLLAGLLSLAGAIGALLLVRERDIERQPRAPEAAPDPAEPRIHPSVVRPPPARSRRSRRFSRLRPSPAMVVACIALFVAMGGAAYAAATIRGKDIADGSLGTSDVANNSLRGRDVRGNSLDGSDINESSLAVVQRVFAVVTDPAGPGNATLSRGRGVTGVNEPTLGGVNVQFNRDVSRCAWTANRNDAGTEVATAGWTQVRLVPGSNNRLEVRMLNATGTVADDDFHLVVTC